MKTIKVNDSKVILLTVNELLKKKKGQQLVTELYADNEDVQRNWVWGTKNMALLVDTLFRSEEGLVVPPLMGIEKDGVIQIADGKQRVIAMECFYDSRIRLLDGTTINGVDCSLKTYKKLPEKVKESFLNAPVLIYVTPYKSDTQTKEMFVRNNNGVNLTPIEKTRVKISNKLEILRKITGHQLFESVYEFTNNNKKRFGDTDLALSYIMEELCSGTDHNKASKEKFSNELATSMIEEKVVSNILKKMNYLYSVLKNVEAEEDVDKKKEISRKVYPASNRIILFRIAEVCIKNKYAPEEVYQFLKTYFVANGYNYAKIAGNTSTSNKSSLTVRYNHLKIELEGSLKSSELPNSKKDNKANKSVKENKSAKQNKPSKQVSSTKKTDKKPNGKSKSKNSLVDEIQATVVINKGTKGKKKTS